MSFNRLKHVVALIMLTAGVAGTVFAPAASAASLAGSNDSIPLTHTYRDRAAYRPEAGQLIVPLTLMVAGTAGAFTGWGKHVDPKITRAVGARHRWRIDEVTQFVPYAAELFLEPLGAECDAPFSDRALSAATSAILLEAVVQPVKRVVKRERPDMSDNHSFPSGHTALAFAGAELTRQFYGPWWGAGAYCMASFTGFLRVRNRRHWLTDVAAGAGTGILAARAALWLLPLERRWFHLDRRSRKQSVGYTPVSSPSPAVSILPTAGPDGVTMSFIMIL
ncbi:MAG: phosphatase PAP2 family protein [Paramuribaculum sp.]|nr:phosphatase PAP2 family protein [Paramuribaculum sp.]